MNSSERETEFFKLLLVNGILIYINKMMSLTDTKYALVKKFHYLSAFLLKLKKYLGKNFIKCI